MSESLGPELSRAQTVLQGTTPSSALDAAHQTLRDLRDEQIQDVETAIQKLSEERRRFTTIMINRDCEKLLRKRLRNLAEKCL